MKTQMRACLALLFLICFSHIPKVRAVNQRARIRKHHDRSSRSRRELRGQMMMKKDNNNKNDVVTADAGVDDRHDIIYVIPEEDTKNVFRHYDSSSGGKGKGKGGGLSSRSFLDRDREPR